MNKLFYLLLPLLCGLAASSCVDVDEYDDSPRGNFEALWRIMDEHYCFFDYKREAYGLDWNEVRAKYSARVDDGMTEAQLFEVLGDMLAELRDGHVNMYSPFDNARYWSWKEDYPANFSDSLLRRYLGTDYKIASGLEYRKLDDNTGYIRCSSFSNAIGNAVGSCLQVCGCVLFFRMTEAVLVPFLPQTALTIPVMSAFLEISAGCSDFAALGGRYALYGCCACLSVLGLSVWAQISLLLQGAVPLRLLLVHRTVHLFVFLAMVGLLVRFLPGTAVVYRSMAERVVTTQRLPWDAAVLVFAFLCASLYKVRQNFYNK